MRVAALHSNPLSCQCSALSCTMLMLVKHIRLFNYLSTFVALLNYII